MLFTVGDIETTGLSHREHDIIQFAYAITNEFGKVIKAECLYFYYPGVERSWSEQAYDVHGIPLEELRKHAEEFEVNCKKMWIAVAKSNFVGYNSDRFDLPFIKGWLRRMGFPMPEEYTSHDVMNIVRPHVGKYKLTQATESLGFTADIISRITETNFGTVGRAHLAFYDVTATSLLFSYAVRKKWVNLTPVTATEVSENYTERHLDEAEGKTLYNNIKYYIKDHNDNVYEVALCPDASKYVYYMHTVTDKTGIFVENEKEPGIYRNGLICIRVTDNTITLEPYKEA